MSHQEIIASAIANSRGMRRGVPPILNILGMLPQKLVDEVMDEAQNVIDELKENGLDIYGITDTQ